MKRYDALSFIIGSRDVLDNMFIRHGMPVRPFAEDTIHFLDIWSEKIRAIPRTEKDTWTAVFGFWCRKLNISQIKKEYPDVAGYASADKLNIDFHANPEGDQLEQAYIFNTCMCVGRGVCLQFVPNNIPALFAYSLAAGLLAGCSVVMRLPSGFDTDSALIKSLREALAACPECAKRIVLVTYDHDKDITDWLSLKCDVRVIWGGNASIAEIQTSKLKDSALDIVFPDRHSMAVLSACSVNAADDNEFGDLIRNFFNDTYLTDQNACSSPNIICWVGDREETAAAEQRFWSGLEEYLEGRYEIQAETAIKKLEQAMLMSALGLAEGIIIGRGEGLDSNNRIVRVNAAITGPELWDYAIPGGFFIECECKDTESVTELFTPICQSVSCYGSFDGDLSRERSAEVSIKEILQRGMSPRLVDIGHSLDFSLIWDGQDMIRQMCRKAPEEFLIERPGCDIYARKQGAGPALLLIHGVAVDSDYFEETARILERDFTVITYDRRGYSRSVMKDAFVDVNNLKSREQNLSKPGEMFDHADEINREHHNSDEACYNKEAAENYLSVSDLNKKKLDEPLAEQVRDAAAVIDTLAGGSPVTVCGCSAGGLIALELARSMPEYVGRLMLYETAYTTDEESLSGMDEWHESLDEAAGRKSLAKAMLLFIKAIGKPDPEAPEKPPEKLKQNMINLEVFLHKEADSLLGYSKRHPDIRLSMPCVCGAGTLDRGNLFYNMMEHTAGEWNVPFQEVMGCHNACEDRPEAFASWVRDNIVHEISKQ